ARHRALAAIALIALSGCGMVSATDDRAVRLRRELEVERSTIGRLADGTAWRACATDTTPLIAISQCGGDATADARKSTELAALATAVRERSASDSSPASARAIALLDLRFPGAASAGIDRAIAALQRVVDAAPRDPGALNALAVAELSRAERDQDLRS